MEFSIMNRFQLRWALAALLVVVSLVGCRSTGGSKWSFGRKDMEKSDQLATYKENRQAVQTDGDVIPPANKAKPEATIALGERRLADSGYSNSNGPKYTESLDQLNQPPANPADNYAAVEQMAVQANADASKNAAPVAYKEENISPMDSSAFPTNVPPMVSPSQTVASNGPSDPLALPPVPEMPPIPNADPVPAPVSPAIASDSSKNNNVIAPVQYQTEISESEAQAYTPSQGAFLPGSLDMNRFESEFSNPSQSSQPETNQTYPTTPSASPSPLNSQSLPGLSENHNVPHELKNNFDNSRVVIVKNSRSVMTESDFCTLGYHEVASLASGNPVIAKTSPASSARQMPAEYNAVPVVQTSLVRPVEDAPSSETPVNLESIADSVPPVLMNSAPHN